MCTRDLMIGLLIFFSAHTWTKDATAIERVNTAGAREAALSQAVVALSGSFSVFNNQAFLTENRSPFLSMSFCQPYFINGYRECALSMVYPSKPAIFALGVTQTAIDKYSESTFGVSISKELTVRLSAGLLFNYFFLNFPEVNRQKGSFIVDGGVRFRCTEELELGFHIKNIAWSRIETFQYGLNFPLIIRGGASLHLTNRILTAGETIFEEGFGVGLRLGTEVMMTDNFRIRGGISTNPFQHSFGFGYKWNFCQMDFAMVHHELLGYSPTISFCFNIGSAE